MNQMLKWAGHSNHHVRRLASEGCRPSLPWAMALRDFKRDPSMILPILEQLKDDPSEYVRKSVANNLNDISKDNPDLVLEIAKRWRGIGKDTDWIIKHACRTLLRKGSTKALSHFNFFHPESIIVKDLNCSSLTVPIEGAFQFSFKLESKEENDVNLRIEYGLYFMKANGKQTRKVFKISEFNMKERKDIVITKSHSFKTLTTRKHYPGNHNLTIIVNGVEMAEKAFLLTQ
ncbi:MAG TPA: DNA alkylation repair protein [Cytophagales bacterium]|nr:DNA alkylation repair protein [Cytophagales bacterium]